MLPLRWITPKGLLFLLLISMVGPSSVGFALDTWTWRQPVPKRPFSDIVYADGKFVAVSADGATATSTDGAVWSVRSSCTNKHLESVAYGAGRFWAVGAEGTIISSLDGESWELHSTDSTVALLDICFAQNQFVMVGIRSDKEVILTSPDGVAWTERTTDNTFLPFALTFGAGKFVTVGEDGTVRHSVDGVHWLDGSISASGDDLLDIVYTGSSFLAVGDRGTVATSNDGVTWVRGNAGTSNDVRRVAFGNGRFVAAGGRGVYTSVDGASWSNVSPDTTKWMRAAAFGNGVFVATGSEALFTSSNGVAWIDLTSEARDRYHVTYRNGQFVSGGHNFSVLTSANGIDWAANANTQLATKGNWAFGNGVYVSANSDAVFTSVDGDTWEYEIGNGLDVVFDGTQFLSIDSQGSVRTSPDGESWSVVATGLPDSPFGLTDLIFAEGRYVATFAREIFSSEDGVNWVKRHDAPIGYIPSVAHGGGMFVAVGTDSTHSMSILSSPDGITWTERAEPDYEERLAAIAFGGGYFVTAGSDGAILTSSDGIGWILQNAGAGDLDSFVDVAFGGGLFVVVGDDGVILTAPPSAGGPAPFIVSPSSRLSVEGHFFSHVIELEHDHILPVTFAASGLPSGLSFDTSTGILSGTAPVAGNYLISITATNPFKSVSQTMVLDVLGDSNWSKSNPRAVKNPVESLIHDGTQFVGAGAAGSISVSLDGSVWNTIETGASTDLNGLAFGNGTYVAVGNSGSIGVSGNLQSWQWLNPGTLQTFTSVAYGNATFVAVGTTGIVFVSPDGVNWTEVNSPATRNLSAIAFLNNQFLALQENGTRVYTSADGLSWASSGHIQGSVMSDIAYGGGTYVIAAGSSVYLSQDGLSWTSDSAGPGFWHAIVYDGSQFVAAGENGVIFTSPDGNTWTDRSVDIHTDFQTIAVGSGILVAAGDNSVIVSSSDGANWTDQSNSLGGSLEDIAYAYGLYVAVGDRGRILTSSDGSTWTPRDVAFNTNDFDSVAFGAGHFVAIADRYIYTSADGLTWTSGGTRPFPYTDTAKDLIFAGGQFVSVGDDGDIRTSPDGLNWTSQTSGTSNDLHSVAFENGLYVAVGSGSTILTSSDAITWSTRNSPSTMDLYGVAYGLDGFVAVGLHGLILYSDDAVSWTTVPVPFQSTLRSITYGTDGFAAVGDEVVLKSTNGTAWTAFAADSSLQDILWDGDRYLAVGAMESVQVSSTSISRPIVGFQNSISGNVGVGFSVSPETGNSPTSFSATGLPPGVTIDPVTGALSGTPSTDGTFIVTLTASNASGDTSIRIEVFLSHWIPRVSGVANHLQAVAFGDGVFVATGFGGVLLSSTDGINWAQRSSGTTSHLLDAIYENGQFIVVGSSGNILTSADGVNWLKRVSPSNGGITSVCFGNGIYVAVGSLGLVLTSLDGVNWTQRDPGLTHTMYGVTYGGGKYVAVTSSGRALSSADGINWTNVTTGSSSSINSIAYANGEFVAVSGKIRKSPDGVAWTIEDSPTGFEEVRNIRGTLLATGSNIVAYSKDGIQWTPTVSSSLSKLEGITSGNDMEVAVGDNGTILTSTTLGGVAYVPSPSIVVEEPADNSLIDGVGSIDFGGVQIGSPATRTVFVRNTGTAELTGLAVDFMGGQAGDFSAGTLSATTLAPGETASFALSFSPGAFGARQSTMQIASNDPDNNPFDVILNGSGASPEIVVEQPAGNGLADGVGSVDYGGQLLGGNQVRTFTVRNTGGAPLSGLATTVSGSNPGDFVATAPLQTELAANESTTFTVRFTPSATGSRSAVIQIANNDPDEAPFDIALQGTGRSPEIAVEHGVDDLTDAVSSVEFTGLAIGQTTEISLTIRNTGNAPLTGLGVSFSGASASQFSTDGFANTTINPNARMTLDIALTPAATGSGDIAANLHISSSDLDESPFDIGLQGSLDQWTTLQGWGSSFGLTGEALLLDADDDGDGKTLLEEYAFDLDPTVRDGSSGVPIRLNGDRLQADFLMRRSDPDLTYTVEFGSTIVELAPATEPSDVTVFDANFHRVIVNDSATTATHSSRFGQVRLSYGE